MGRRSSEMEQGPKALIGEGLSSTVVATSPKAPILDKLFATVSTQRAGWTSWREFGPVEAEMLGKITGRTSMHATSTPAHAVPVQKARRDRTGGRSSDRLDRRQ